MSSFTVKRVTLALSLFLTYTTLSYADDSDLHSESSDAPPKNLSTHSESLDSRVSSLESRMSAVKTQTAKGTVGAKMATAHPLIDGYGFFFTADALYWQVKEWGTQYVIKNKEPSTLPVEGKSKQAHFDWDLGFRVGGGYNFEHDEWDAQVYFTWFETDADNRTHADKNGILFPQIGLPEGSGKKAKIHWDVDYYVIDAELGRNFFVSKFLAFRPFFGIETAWVNQEMRFNERFAPGSNQTQTHLIVKSRNDFWGIGPRTGVDSTWYFGEHFSLFGNLSGALLWGDFDVRDKEKTTGVGSIKLTNAEGDFHAIVPNVKTILGLQWDTNFSENEHHIGIKLGYEFQYLWKQNQMLNIYTPSTAVYERESADLSINGITLDVRFDF